MVAHRLRWPSIGETLGYRCVVFAGIGLGYTTTAVFFYLLPLMQLVLPSFLEVYCLLALLCPKR